MIAISWPDILAGALAASILEGRTLTAAETTTIRTVAQGVASVLSSSIEAPGQAAPSFSAMDLGALILRAATTDKTTTLTAAPSQAEDIELVLPTAQGGAATRLANDGTGQLSWVADGGGTVTSLTQALGITLTPNPITGAGTVGIDTAVVPQLGGALTAGRIVIAGTAGVLVDDAALLWDATNDRIGIGVTPLAPLHIKKDAVAGPYYSQFAIEPASANSDAAVYLKTTRGASREWFFGAGTGGAGDSGKFRIFDITANADRLNIDHNGYIVLGGTTASGPLHIIKDAPGAPFYSQIIVAPPSANVDASISLKTTHGAGRHWYIAAGTSGLADVAGLRITDLTAGAQRFGIDTAGLVYAVGNFRAVELRCLANGFTAGFKAGATLAADKTWTLPLVDAAGFMKSDGAGVLSFSLDGSGLTALNASNASSGTLADARLSASVPLRTVVVEAGTSRTMAANEDVHCTAGAMCNVTLPSSAAVGSRQSLVALDAFGWTLKQGAGQSVKRGNGATGTTVGVGGSIQSGAIYDSITVECIVADTTWVVISSVGTFTVV